MNNLNLQLQTNKENDEEIWVPREIPYGLEINKINNKKESDNIVYFLEEGEGGYLAKTNIPSNISITEQIAVAVKRVLGNKNCSGYDKNIGFIYYPENSNIPFIEYLKTIQFVQIEDNNGCLFYSFENITDVPWQDSIKLLECNY